MGWRDVQAGVADGSINYRKSPDKFGSFLEGFASVYAPAMQRKADKEDAADLLKTKELKAAKLEEQKRRRDDLAESRKLAKAEEAKQIEYKKNAEAVMAEMGYSPQTDGYNRAFNKAFSMITGGRTVEGTITSFKDMIDPTSTSPLILTTDNAPAQGPMPAAKPSTDMSVFAPLTGRESGIGGYDALLNQSQNSQFANKKVSQMNLGEVIAFQSERGGTSYHEWSKTNMPEGTEAKAKGLGSTPAGKYQFVGDTMKDIKQRGWKELGFDENTPFNEDTQDALFLWLAQDKMKGASSQEQKRTALRNTWEGVKDPAEVSDAQLDEMIAGIETGTFSSDITDMRSEPVKPGEVIKWTSTVGKEGNSQIDLSGTVDENGMLKFKGYAPIDTKLYSSVTELETNLGNFFKEDMKDLVAENGGFQQTIVQRVPQGDDLLQTEAARPESMEGGIRFDPRSNTKFDLAPFITETKKPIDVLAQRTLIISAMDAQNIDPVQRNNILKLYDENPYITEVLADIPTEREIAVMSEDDLVGLVAVYEKNAITTGKDTPAGLVSTLNTMKTALAAKQKASKKTKVSTPKAAWMALKYPNGFATPAEAARAAQEWSSSIQDPTVKPPTTLSALKISILTGTASWEALSDEAKLEAIKNLEGADSTTLTKGQVSQRFLTATLDSTSTDAATRAAAETYLKVTYPAEMAALEASSIEADPDPVPMIATIGGVDTSVVLKEGEVYRLEDTSFTTPIEAFNETTNIGGFTSLTSEELSKAADSAVARASQPIDDQRKKMAAAISVTKQGYELEKLARTYPGVLTATGTAQALFKTAKTEVGAIFDLIGQADGNAAITQDTVLNDIKNYLSTSSLSDEQSRIIYEFASASTLYIFAAGKALGQEGNGFSNQDYNNIRKGLLNSNDIEAFSKTMRSFAHRAIVQADGGALSLKDSTAVDEMRRKGRLLGGEGDTAYEVLAKRREIDPNLPEYTKWANPEIDFTIDVQPITILNAAATKITEPPPEAESATAWQELAKRYNSGEEIIATQSLIDNWKLKYAAMIDPQSPDYSKSAADIVTNLKVGDKIINPKFATQKTE